MEHQKVLLEECSGDGVRPWELCEVLQPGKMLARARLLLWVFIVHKHAL